ncbi:MAG TPA: molybdopterin-dependent oxidoreductase [Thermoanaerobaculia bacterium]|nr:molybdopterin-dependent oxidoreductase [Thermoanaerobaculia bacterium]
MSDIDKVSGLVPRASDSEETAKVRNDEAAAAANVESHDVDESSNSEAGSPRPEALVADAERNQEMSAPAVEIEPKEPAAPTRGPKPEASVDEVERELKRLSRRGFISAAVAAGAGYGAWNWLRTRDQLGYLQWPLRRVLELNESVAETYFRTARLSPTFPAARILRPARINGNLGLDPRFDPSTWRLRIEGIARPLTLTLDDIKALPRREQITEFRCIEGWSMIVKWTGARLADLMARYPPAERVQYVSMETPDRGYYVGLDMDSAMHPQTLLAYELNDEPLSMDHGAPLRLAIPVKYGIKNIKRIGVIRYTNIRPADFWAEQGYDWYAGH